jgi:hypothetical protein
MKTEDLCDRFSRFPESFHFLTEVAVDPEYFNG